MQIGVRAHDFGRMEIEQLADTLQKHEFTCAQLALTKAFTGIERYEDITLSHLERIRASFERCEIEIPIFSCYMNLGCPDKEVRSYAVETIKKCLGYCKEIDARAVGTETAYGGLSKEEKQQWYPYMLDSIQRVTEEAQRLDVKFAIEPVVGHPLDSLETLMDIINRVDDKRHLRVIFDACNALQIQAVDRQEDYWNTWLDSIGEYIEAMHIKDVYYDEHAVQRGTALGKGIIRYDVIAGWVRKNRKDMYLLREELCPETAEEDLKFIRDQFERRTSKPLL